MTDWAALAATAAAQHQLLTLRQAECCGMSPFSFRRQVHDRGAHELYPGVIALPGSVPDPRRSAKAAELVVGQPVRVTGRMALHLWGLGPPPPMTDVAVPRHRQAPQRPGITGHRLRVWHSDDATERHGITVTAVPLTLLLLLLLGEALPVPELRGILLRAKQQRLCTLDQVAACCARHPDVKGVEALRRLAWELEDSRADSVFEEAVRARSIERGSSPTQGRSRSPYSGAAPCTSTSRSGSGWSGSSVTARRTTTPSSR